MSAKKLIYLDNSSTSYPKPRSVIKAMENAMLKIGASPGRGGYHSAHKADQLVYNARKEAAKLFGLKDPSRLIFTPGGTYSLNVAIKGLLRNGDHAIVTGRQHNAVTRLINSQELGIQHTKINWDGEAEFNLSKINAALKGDTKAIIVNHASNLDGLLFPLKQIGQRAEELGLILIVDAAQTAGIVDINMNSFNISALCTSGHKSLFGPTGIGILGLSPDVEINPQTLGGTGSFSEEIGMPKAYPDRLEAGTANLPGIAGLSTGIKEIKKIGIKKIFNKKMELCRMASGGLSKIDGVSIYWPKLKKNRIPIFSFNIEGVDRAEVGDILDQKFNIACRVGLHCTPESHKEVGTYPDGSIRFAPGYFNSKSDIKTFIKAVAQIADKK